MAIENRDLKPGMKLTATFKKKSYTAEVVKTEDGLRIKLADGKEFKSVSAAGSHVMGGTACNGWRFWSLEGETAPAKPVKKATEKAEKPAGKTAKVPAKQTTATSPKTDKAPETAPVAPGSPDGARGAEEQGS